MGISVLENSFVEKDLVIVYQEITVLPYVSTVTFNPAPEDVIMAALDLGILNDPWDVDFGTSGQEMRYGVEIGKDKVIYLSYAQLQKEFSGEEMEQIALHLSEKEETRRQKEFQTKLLNQLI